MPALVILAAGMSRRFGSPKQFQPVGPAGEALMDFAIHDAIAAGCEEVLLILHEGLVAQARDRFARFSVPLRWVLQSRSPFPGRSKPWGTAHAILEATRAIDGPLVVINADDYYGREPIVDAFHHATRRPDTHAIVGFEAERTLSGTGGVSRALIDHRHGDVRTVTELRDLRRVDAQLRGMNGENASVVVDPTARVSMNLWVFAPSMGGFLESAFAEWRQSSGNNPDLEFQIADVATAFIAKQRGSFHLLTASGQTYGMTFVEDREIVRRQLATLTRDGVYPSPLFKD